VDICIHSSIRMRIGGRYVGVAKIQVHRVVDLRPSALKDHNFFLFIYCFFTIYSRYLKRVISKRDGCEYLKQVPSSDGSLELI
jgi:hypothetical protein